MCVCVCVHVLVKTFICCFCALKHAGWCVRVCVCVRAHSQSVIMLNQYCNNSVSVWTRQASIKTKFIFFAPCIFHHLSTDRQVPQLIVSRPDGAAWLQHDKHSTCRVRVCVFLYVCVPSRDK